MVQILCNQGCRAAGHPQKLLCTQMLSGSSPVLKGPCMATVPVE